MVWARVVTTTFAAVLASRRGREPGGVLAALLGVAVAPGAQQMETMLTMLRTGRTQPPHQALLASAGCSAGRRPRRVVRPKALCGWSTAASGSSSGCGRGGGASPASLTTPRSVHAERVRPKHGVLGLPLRLVARLLRRAR